MRIRNIFLVTSLFILFLAACVPSEQAIQTAIAQTQAANLVATISSEQTSIKIPTALSQSSIVAILLSNGYKNGSYYYDDGVFEDGVSYEVYSESNWGTIVVVGYDGSLTILSGGYKAPSLNSAIGNVIEGVFGQDVLQWVSNNFKNAQGGHQEGNANNCQITILVGKEKTVFSESHTTGIVLIIEIIPYGANSHIGK
jgi:hypothetical protein